MRNGPRRVDFGEHRSCWHGAPRGSSVSHPSEIPRFKESPHTSEFRRHPKPLLDPKTRLAATRRLDSHPQRMRIARPGGSGRTIPCSRETRGPGPATDSPPRAGHVAAVLLPCRCHDVVCLPCCRRRVAVSCCYVADMLRPFLCHVVGGVFVRPFARLSVNAFASFNIANAWLRCALPGYIVANWLPSRCHCVATSLPWCCNVAATLLPWLYRRLHVVAMSLPMVMP